jgi:hypothetical protein
LAEDKGINVRSSVAETAQRTKDMISRLNAVNRPAPESKFDLVWGPAFDITIGE